MKRPNLSTLLVMVVVFVLFAAVLILLKPHQSPECEEAIADIHAAERCRADAACNAKFTFVFVDVVTRPWAEQNCEGLKP